SSSSVIVTTYPDPPMNQTGRISHHDHSYTKYGDLDRQTIAKKCQFNLQSPPSSFCRQPMRLNRKSLAIISWTNVSKDAVMNHIKREFPLENIQYICVGKGMSEIDHQQTLEVQIIFKEKINKRTRFLDGITQTCCNYQLTKNVLAWNDYIKKDVNCLEFGQFESKTSHGCKYSSSLLVSTTAASEAIAEATAQAAKKAIAKATAAEAIAKSTAKAAAAAAVAEKNAVSVSIPFDQNQSLVLKRKAT
ncbi:unnamed protein product, partial [Rotaria sordida]